MKIKLAFKLLYSKFVSFFAEAIIEGFYGGFFQYKSNAKKVSSEYIYQKMRLLEATASYFNK